jgi:hypothetical protein
MRATCVLGLVLSACARRAAVPGPPAVVVAEPRVAAGAAAACDAVAAVVEPVPGVVVTRADGAFQDPVYQRPYDGCRVLVVGSFEALGDDAPVDVVLHDTLAARGWTDDYDYSADGPDGTDFALRRDDVFCVVEGRWEGGVFESEDPPPSDRYELTVGCAEDPES